MEELDEKYIVQYISEKLIQACKKWKISDQKIIARVSDNCANMVKACTDTFDKRRSLKQ